MTAPATSSLATAAIPAFGSELRYLMGGSGPAVFVLPRDQGHPPRLDFLEALAERHTVISPWYPGFHNGGDPATWEWVANVRDLAVIQLRLVEAVAPGGAALVGLGFGGWVAAEMATMLGSRLRALLLAAPMGILPAEGYIYDQFLGSTEVYARAGFADQQKFDALFGAMPEYDQLEAWETDREMTSRIAWKPYMYNPSLPRLLEAVRCPVHIAWGSEDRIVPPATAAQWQAALPHASLEPLEGVGHSIDLEHPATLAAIARSFFATTA